MAERNDKLEIVEMDAEELTQLRGRAASGQLTVEDGKLLVTLIDAYLQILLLLSRAKVSLAKLRKIVFGSTTEKTKNVLPAADDADDQEKVDQNASQEDDGNELSPAAPEKPRRKGHGRNGADAYTGATHVFIAHPTLQAGDACPECEDGTVYRTTKPAVLVRVVGQPPLGATVYELERLRCNLCTQVFTAAPPAEAGLQKYQTTAVTMIALLKYGAGMPFHRLQKLQQSLGIPLPASTQWDNVNQRALEAEAIYYELIRQAAQAGTFFNDDTSARILQRMGERARKAVFAEDAEQGLKNKDGSDRTGLYTSGIVAEVTGQRRIALFFTGQQHAGENLRDVLQKRAQGLDTPIHMCDALSRNVPAQFETIVANCLAHARRNFVDVVNLFPAHCQFVLQTFEAVYKNDAETRKQQFTPQERLTFHQTHSGPFMQELKNWCRQQLDDHLVEPNSPLGQAIAYLLKHWKKLTLFLRKAGAPLDNNICERALKKAILHRKNSLFFKTDRGAHVGDIFMSLIYTCYLNDVNPFDYLNAIADHAGQVAQSPQDWMPWNYLATLAIATRDSPAEQAA